MSNDLKITEVEATVLRLEPGDVLAVNVKGEDFNHEQTAHSLQETVKKLFPNNKVMIFSMDTGHEIVFTTIKQENAETGENNELNTKST